MNVAKAKRDSIQPAQGDLSLQSVESLAELAQLRSHWDGLEALDPESTVFLSWSWNQACFAQFPGRWRVICVWNAERLVGVLPLKYRIRWSRSRAEFQTEIEPGGKLFFSEYCGFLCAPDPVSSVLETFADYLGHQPWVSIEMKYGVSRDRAARFMACFPNSEFQVKDRTYFINNGQTNNLMSLRIPLDQGFDGYLQKRIKPKLRSQMQQYRRKYIESGVLDCHFHSGDEASDLLSELFEHWMSKWSPVKGMSQAKLVRDTYARYLRLAAELGLLRVATLRQGQDLMGGLAFILDPAGRRIHCILSVRNEAVKGGYIGPLLHSEALRFAAEQGFTVYDFCHGDQSYKTRFGGEPLRLSYFSIHRRNLDQSPGVLDPVCIPNAMEKLTRFIRKGDRSKAEAASRQIRNLIRDNLS